MTLEQMVVRRKMLPDFHTISNWRCLILSFIHQYRMSKAYETFWRRLAVRKPFAVELSVDIWVPLADC